jgi:hypothetical protein
MARLGTSNNPMKGCIPMETVLECRPFGGGKRNPTNEKSKKESNKGSALEVNKHEK